MYLPVTLGLLPALWAIMKLKIWKMLKCTLTAEIIPKE